MTEERQYDEERDLEQEVDVATFDTDVDELSPLEKVQQRRAARKAKVKEESDLQKALDLDAIDELEIAHGDGNVAVVEIPYESGLPCLLAARAPKPIEIKRYRETNRIKDSQVDQKKATASAEALATQCLIYPDKDTYAKIREVRPAAAAALGLAALKLSGAQALADGKS